MDKVSNLQKMVTQTLFLSIELRESPHGAHIWRNKTFSLLCVDIRFKMWHLIFLLDGILLLNSN